MGKKEVNYYNGKTKKWKKDLINNVDKQIVSEYCCKYDRNTLPSDLVIEYFIETYWNKSEAVSEKALNNLFKNDYIGNRDIHKVYIKVSALNDIYSTQLSNDDKLNISKVLCCFDEELSNKEYNSRLVNDICEEVNSIIDKKPYSFVTKYCSHENAYEYPIFDGYVEVMLKWFRKKDKYGTFDFPDSALSERNYNIFREILIDFCNKFEISKSFKEVDEYLWTAGKIFFPNYVEKSIIPKQ